MLKDFVAAHFDSEARYTALSSLRNARKPRIIMVENFYYRMIEINELIEWLPGDQETLTPSEIKCAFYDAMPNKWRKNFETAPKVKYETTTLAEMRSYFRKQEQSSNNIRDGKFSGLALT